ncbi:accessory Sec system glycosyltransferase Asp1 [Fructilactobacillus lindneri]|uniref:accessory Sec system glycosyltransferase Asp1 n=1 Tax=Fructilactobacillus lindneri TaxID=53444 RepID=UPI002987FF84|nr:accessory Sec system glycosyltransferase Asp1 [Fructilactobacillus lindneri]
MYRKRFKLPSVAIAAFRSGADLQNQFYLQLPAVRKIALLDQDVSLAKVRDKVSSNQKVKWIFPSQILEKQFTKSETSHHKKLDTTAIEPYPTDFNLGASNEFEDQIVYWQFKQQSNETIEKSLTNILPMVLKNEKIILLMDAPTAQQNLIKSLAKQWIKSITTVDPDGSDYQKYFEIGKPQSFSTEAEWIDYLDEHLEDEPEFLGSEQIHQFYRVGNFLSRIKFVTEKDDINEIFSKIRLFIDQGVQADLRKQILAISTGVPIISFAVTDLVNQGGNGFQKTTSGQLLEQVNYFLQDLHHWNQGLVDSVSLIEEYEPDKLLKRWKVVMTDG